MSELAELPDAAGRDGRGNAPRRRRGRAYLIVGLVCVVAFSSLIGFWFFCPDRVEPYVFRVPFVTTVFHVEILPLDPFIIPVQSDASTYVIFTLEMLVADKEMTRVSESIAHVRAGIYSGLVRSVTTHPKRKPQFDETIAKINAELGRAAVKVIWIRAKRLM